jgi:hypothetical protein
MYLATQMARTCTARSSQRTYTATARGMVGGSTERQTPSTRLVGARGRITTYYLEGTKGRPSGRPQVLATSRWPEHPPPRSQPGSLPRHGRPYFLLTRYDDRITPTLVPIGYQQHSHLTPVHPFCGDHVGRQAQPPPRQRRLAARPLCVPRNGRSIRPAHDRPVCVGSQHATAPVQRELGRPVV